MDAVNDDPDGWHPYCDDEEGIWELGPDACGYDGVASFDLIRHWHHADGAFLYAFDLIELNGDDLRRDPLIVRKATLASVLARAAPGLRLRPKRRDLRAGADQLWIELGINRLADAGTAANDALAAWITAMRTSSLSTSTTHGLGELIAVVRRCRGHCRSAWQAASTVLTVSFSPTVRAKPRRRCVQVRLILAIVAEFRQSLDQFLAQRPQRLGGQCIVCAAR